MELHHFARYFAIAIQLESRNDVGALTMSGREPGDGRPRETPLGDQATIRALLVATARAGRVMTYSALLAALGHSFTRPKMRSLCRVIGEIDHAARANDEPELAVLVVRQSNQMPGRGWWDGASRPFEYDGTSSGPEAVRFIRSKQQAAFDYWQSNR